MGRCFSFNLVWFGGFDFDDNDNDVMVLDRMDIVGNVILVVEFSF